MAAVVVAPNLGGGLQLAASGFRSTSDIMGIIQLVIAIAYLVIGKVGSSKIEKE